ncbi:hypothetical protein COCNU_scaffold007470G000020 [Cocos nucifera]|nr:hypothetical protein [Cocos nucifera]
MIRAARSVGFSVLRLTSESLTPSLLRASPIPESLFPPTSPIRRPLLKAGLSDEALGRSATPVHARFATPAAPVETAFKSISSAIRSWPQNRRPPTRKL